MLKGVHEVSERSLEVSLVALHSPAVHLNMVSMGSSANRPQIYLQFSKMLVCRHLMLLLRLSGNKILFLAAIPCMV